MSGRNQKQGRFVPALAIGGIAYAVLVSVDTPVVVAGEIQLLPATAAGCMALAGLALVADTLSGIASLSAYLRARTPTGRKGKARFVSRLGEVRGALVKHGWGPYFGYFKGVPIFADIEAVSYVIGPTGTGKSTKFIIPFCLALRGEAKVIYDYKSDLIPQMAKALRKRGERLTILDLGNIAGDLVGQPTDTYNPLILISEVFLQQGGLAEVDERLRGLAMAIDPGEKASDVENGSFWKASSQSLIAFAVLVAVLLDGENATLAQVLQLINDKAALRKHAQWMAGMLETESLDASGELIRETVQFPIYDAPWASGDIHDADDIALFAEYLRALASGMAEMLDPANAKMADSILATARQSALAYFPLGSRADKLTRACSFRFSDMKETERGHRGALNVGIMLDPTKPAQQKVLGIWHWCMLTELKRHPNKNKKIYVIADEAANLTWPNLSEDLTTLRAYSVIPILAFQNFPAFRQRHGVGLETLLSEAQATLFMPGQRNPETLSMIRRILGNRSVIARSDNAAADGGPFSMGGYSLSEDAVPLMDEEEIRTCDQAILILGNNKPMKVDLPSVSVMAPLNRQLGRSPFHSKPFRKRTRLRIRPYPRSLASTIWAATKFIFTLGRSA